MISSIICISKETYLNLQRNFLMTAATISTVLISTLLLGIFLVATLNLSSWTRKVIDQLQVISYLNDNVGEAEMRDLYQKIKEFPEVKEVQYVSKEQAFARLKATMEGKINLKNLPGNPLPNSFEIKLKNMSKVKILAEKVGRLPGISKVKYGKHLAESLLSLHRVVSFSGAILVFLSLLSTFFIVLNTIRLTIIARDKEIKVMSLVGATNWLIRWPFIFEGIIQGLLGTLPALLLIYFSYKFLVPTVAKTLPFIPFLSPGQIMGYLGWIMLLTGMGMGAVGAYISVNRHLNYE